MKQDKGKQPIQKTCPVCGSDDIRNDYESPETMRCCERCGSEFLIDGDILCNARAIGRPKEYENYSARKIAKGKLPLDFPEWQGKQSVQVQEDAKVKFEQAMDEFAGTVLTADEWDNNYAGQWVGGKTKYLGNHPKCFTKTSM